MHYILVLLLFSAVIIAGALVFTVEDQTNIEPPKFMDSNCTCQNFSCSCCAHVDIDQIGLNVTGCIDTAYLPDEYGLELKLTLNGKVILDERGSVKNPPSICFGRDWTLGLIDMCTRFHDLEADKKHFHGCLELDVRVERINVVSKEIGCLNIPSGSRETVYQVEQLMS